MMRDADFISDAERIEILTDQRDAWREIAECEVRKQWDNAGPNETRPWAQVLVALFLKHNETVRKISDERWKR